MLVLASLTIVACKALDDEPAPTSLEARARAAEVEVQAPAVSASLPSIAAPRLAPDGVDEDLWSRVHWFPDALVGISGSGSVEEFPLLSLLRSQGREMEHRPGETLVATPACRAVEAGLVAAYGIEWAEPPQSFVFYGKGRREQVEACAEVFVAAMDGSVDRAGELTRLRALDGESYLGFAEHGELLVVVSDGDPERIRSILAAEPDRLAANQRILALLGRVAPRRPIWSASTRDFAAALLAVPSAGLVFSMDGGAGKGVVAGELVFETEDAAARALAGTGRLSSELVEAFGMEIPANVRRAGQTIVFEVDLSEELFRRDPAALEAGFAKLLRTWEARAAEAGAK